MFLKYILLSLLTTNIITYQSNAKKIEGLRNILVAEEEFQIITDISKNITLPCWPKSFPNKSSSVYWEKSGRRGKGESVLSDGSLFLSDLSKSDTRLYICRMAENDLILTKVRLYVRGPPQPPSSVVVNASALEALIKWHLNIDSHWQSEMGGVPTFLLLRYRLVPSSSWKQIPNPIVATQSYYHVRGLTPNSTYEFQLWSYNSYYESDVVSVLGTTLANLNEVELSYRMLQSSKVTSPRVWMMAAVIVLLAVNVAGTIVLIVYSRKNHRVVSNRTEDSEHIELVPNIIENPSYNSDTNLLSASTSALNDLSDFV